MALARVAVIVCEIIPPIIICILLLCFWIVNGTYKSDSHEFRKKTVKWILGECLEDLESVSDESPDQKNGTKSAGNQNKPNQTGMKCLDVFLFIYCTFLILVAVFTFWSQFLFTVTTECGNEDSCFLSDGSSLNDSCDDLPNNASLVCYRWSFDYAGAAADTLGIVALMKALIIAIKLLMDLSTKVSSNFECNLCSFLCCYIVLMIALAIVVLAATLYTPVRNALFFNGFMLDFGALLQHLLTIITAIFAPLLTFTYHAYSYDRNSSSNRQLEPYPTAVTESKP